MNFATLQKSKVPKLVRNMAVPKTYSKWPNVIQKIERESLGASNEPFIYLSVNPPEFRQSKWLIANP